MPGEGDDEGPGLGVTGGKADSANGGYPAYGALPEGADLDAPVQVLFAPDEPVVTLEVAEIDRIRQARRADPAQYEEGANPYRIRYAVYNLRNPDIVEHLALAHNEGVDVQILIESDQLSPDRDYNTSDEYLVAHGFELQPDHRTLTDAERRTADLIGIVSPGLMHLKTRIFEAPGYAAVLSGSMNPGDEAVANEETLHLIRDPRLVARYATAYDEILHNVAHDNVWDADAGVNVLFTPEHSGPKAGTTMLQWLEAEEEQILLMVFSLRDVSADGVDESLVDVLARKAAAGVPVYAITDRKQSDGIDADGNHVAGNDRTEDRLRQLGVHVYEALNLATPFTAMHHKVAVLGRTHVRVITDAANWSTAGLGARGGKPAQNNESMLFIDSDRLDGGRLGRRYLSQWMRVLSRYAGQNAENGEPAFADTFARLSGLPGWPSAEVRFYGDGVETVPGETAEVLGGRPEVGDWGNGQAVVLSTGQGEYPSWHVAQPVTLPIGLPLEWKLVVLELDGSLRWQPGSNRLLQVISQPLVPSEPVFGRARW